MIGIVSCQNLMFYYVTDPMVEPMTIILLKGYSKNRFLITYFNNLTLVNFSASIKQDFWGSKQHLIKRYTSGQYRKNMRIFKSPFPQGLGIMAENSRKIGRARVTGCLQKKKYIFWDYRHYCYKHDMTAPGSAALTNLCNLKPDKN